MKLITVILKPHKVDNVREKLVEIGIMGLTSTEVRGYTNKKRHTEQYRGYEHKVDFLPKVRLEIAVQDKELKKTITTIISATKVGEDGEDAETGDGKIFITNLEDVIRIRTEEKGNSAL